MLGDVLRIRCSRRGRHALLLVVLVASGVAAAAVVGGRPGALEETRTGGTGLPPAHVASVQEMASPLAAPVTSPPPAVDAAAPPAAAVAPAPPAPAVVPPSVATGPAPAPAPASARAAALLRPRAVPPDVTEWVPSAAPLAASAPVRVEIASVGISARIGPLGLNRDGTLEVPTDFSRAGWYTGRPTPGEAGPAIIVAHRASKRGPGAFWTLPAVQPGQEIVVTRADGRRTRFTIDRVEQHRKDAFPTAAVYGPTSDVALRVITCGGPFEPTLGDHYRDNIIVFARMTGWAA